MTVIKRSYTNQMRFTKDYHKVREFIKRINNPVVTTSNFIWGRWEWMFSLPYFNQDNMTKIGVWENNDGIVALATYEEDIGDVYFLIDNEYSHLKQEILNYAKNNMINAGKVRVSIDDNDREFQLIAKENGFIATTEKECAAIIDIDDKLNYILPDGYTISSCAEEFDIYKYNRVLWRGFNHEGDAPETQQQIIERRISVSGPNLKPNLNIKVVAPNGEYVSYCGMWYDVDTNYALVEPVATDPDYRMMGLGKAAVIEAVKRCGELGAKQTYVGSSQQFYYSIGFYPVATNTWWKLKE